MNYIMSWLEEFWLYVSGPELWLMIGKTTLKVIIIIILAFIIVRIGRKVIDKVFSANNNAHIRLSDRREKTLKRLLRNVLGYTVYFIAMIMILESFDVRVSALLAGAGIAGLAIGFGAQSLVKDIISGFFIIFEDQFSVGDYVSIADMEGTVEEVGFRVTKVKSWTGEQFVIPNGNISQVTNYSIHNGLAVVDVKIPYESDVRETENAINEIMKELPNKYEAFVLTPEIIGVQTLEESHYAIRIIAETLPVYQWSGARIIRGEIQNQLFERGIEIPSPRLVLYSKDNDNEKRGNSIGK